MSISEIALEGEESGRDEASDHYPYTLEEQYRELVQRGRGRAQGLYGLRGNAARTFAKYWAVGYKANCAMYQDCSEDE